MSQEIIDVLNYLGEQLGIAIDWTSENVWPQVMDILGRYRVFELISTGCWLLADTVVAIISILVFRNMIKECLKFKSTKEDNLWWRSTYYSYDLTVFGWILAIVFAFLGVLSIVSIPIDTGELLRWFIIPEIEYLEMLKGLVS